VETPLSLQVGVVYYQCGGFAQAFGKRVENIIWQRASARNRPPPENPSAFKNDLMQWWYTERTAAEQTTRRCRQMNPDIVR
jgi:hypothetical protein